jgi:hypothetical protein
MVAKGGTYQQRATHKLNNSEISLPRYNNTALYRSIEIDGVTMTVDEASNEDFDIYVYGILDQLYPVDKTEMQNRLDTSFNLDWSDREHRISALNSLDEINGNRRVDKRPLIRLFVED